ncbi:MAG: HEAT repeat domain-containing protein [Aggregatilineales bacterium]
MADDELNEYDDDFEEFDDFDLEGELDDDDLMGSFEDDDNDADDFAEEQFETTISAAQMEAFKKKVRREQIILSKANKYGSKQRQKAARLLGEYGEPEAIELLVAIYKKDKDKDVRAAAGDALAMFRGLQEAINDEDPDIQDYAMELVQGIIADGEVAQEPRFKRSMLLPAIGILTVTLIIFGALGVLLPSTGGGEVPLPNVQKTATAVAVARQLELEDPENVVVTLMERYSALSEDTRAMRLQLREVTDENGSVDCTVTFNQLEGLVLPRSINASTHPDLVDAHTRIERGVTTIRQMITDFTEQCGELSDATAFANREALTAIADQLVDVPQLLMDSGVDGAATPSPLPELPSATPTLTLTPTLTPTSTANPLILNKHVTGIESIITRMNALRGDNTLLLGYWGAAATGNTLVCNNLPGPTIPDAYLIPDDEMVDVTDTILQARDSLNTGLELTRSSWDLFERACENGSVTAQAGTQAQVAQTAQTAYNDAQATLDGTP